MVCDVPLTTVVGKFAEEFKTVPEKESPAPKVTSAKFATPDVGFASNTKPAEAC